jgi:hypothetical protein
MPKFYFVFRVYKLHKLGTQIETENGKFPKPSKNQNPLKNFTANSLPLVYGTKITKNAQKSEISHNLSKKQTNQICLPIKTYKIEKKK